MPNLALGCMWQWYEIHESYVLAIVNAVVVEGFGTFFPKVVECGGLAALSIQKL